VISKALPNGLLKGRERPEDLQAEAGLMKDPGIQLIEPMPRAEWTVQLPGFGGAAADRFNCLSVNPPEAPCNRAGAGIAR